MRERTPASQACGSVPFILAVTIKLINQALAALGARTEQLALHLGDQKLLMLDQGLDAGEFSARLDQRGLQRIVAVGDMVSRGCHIVIRSQSPLIRS
jgi:hypothetical protein